ncbi:MAG: GNAT family N-acetyltransferase [Firmicutes bacterium]|nr:GNAT family N-acetyltransferase [Bacillota bacterium]
MTIKIRETEDYERLVPFFIENGLEFSEEDETPTDLVKCWDAFDEDLLVGGFVLARRDGEFICDGIAVHPDYREQELGRKMLRLGIEETVQQGGEKMYLVARAPGFFRREGFETVPRENAPNFFECLTCDQYGVTCHPEVMLKVLK